MERSIRFGLLLNQAERQALSQLAETEGGLSQGAMVRNLIRTEDRKRGLWALPLNGDAQPQPNAGAYTMTTILNLKAPGVTQALAKCYKANTFISADRQRRRYAIRRRRRVVFLPP
jgi:hypothetical protein